MEEVDTVVSEQTHRIERQIEWLKTATPEDWHRVAISFDPASDEPMDALQWIVSQPECDKATALTIFWRAQPQSILSVIAGGRAFDDRLNRLSTVQVIARRFDAEGYGRSHIAFDPGPYLPGIYDEMFGLADQLDSSPFPLCEDMKLPIAGKTIAIDREFAKRYPPEFHNESIRVHYLTALQLEHLEQGTPDDWHVIASNWNWDDELDVLYWIVRQRECDKATALTIFWMGEPTGYDYETEQEEMGASPYSVAPMLRYISERFNTSGYPRSEIAFDYLEARGHDAASEFAAAVAAGQRGDIEELLERQSAMADPKVKIHPDMMVASLPGRKIHSSEIYDTFPAYFEIDGSEIGEGMAMNFDGEPVGSPQKPASHETNATEPDAAARVRAMREQTGGGAEQTAGSSGLAGWIRRLFGR